MFLVQSGLKKWWFIAVVFNYVLVYAIRKGQENQVGLKLNRIHQLQVYADYVILLRDNKQTVINANKEVGLEINVEKTEYILLSRYHNARKICDIL
jgi:hypothetical protein